MIYSRESVRLAVARAMVSHPSMSPDTAVDAVAKLLALDPDTVRECCPGLQPAIQEADVPY